MFLVCKWRNHVNLYFDVMISLHKYVLNTVIIFWIDIYLLGWALSRFRLCVCVHNSVCAKRETNMHTNLSVWALSSRRYKYLSKIQSLIVYEDNFHFRHIQSKKEKRVKNECDDEWSICPKCCVISCVIRQINNFIIVILCERNTLWNFEHHASYDQQYYP